MIERNERMVQAALKRFSAQGYDATSMDQIAKDCEMSKASLYKFVATKEELLIHVVEYCKRHMLCNVQQFHRETELTGRERFRACLEVEIENALSYHQLIILQHREVRFQHNEKVKNLLVDSKHRLMRWHRTCLLEAYEDRLEGHVWDAIVMLQGMIREFLMLLTYGRLDLSVQKIAHFIEQRMYELAMAAKLEAPVLDDHGLEKQLGGEPTDHRVSSKKLMIERLAPIKRHTAGDEELQAAVAMVEHEIAADQPRHFLLESLLSYLKTKTQQATVLWSLDVLLDLVEKERMHVREADDDKRYDT
ncbi:TetR/AcrR family transcriptional regulator [Bacillaceae bacterium SIJ1]|uniref:TetR/AcrR family transcriptional regulator n=1 Tax=Litoribacterium kuwaitense TaxID=1398745 RepID=UPI0013EB0F32|nr:TetR/AcrR family transcriptional regulator [Litoribacterium kuwaitense]NGP44649.1 TetR/AcrR family transcriptional regulator [Litoribacterium kuwaitense]